MALPNKEYWDLRLKERFQPVEAAEKVMAEKYINAYHKVVEDYMGLINRYKTADGSYNWAKLQQDIEFNRSLSLRVGRYQGLMERIETLTERLGIDQNKLIEGVLTNGYETNYYELLFQIQKSAGYELQFNLLDPKRLNQAIHTKWAKDGHEFSDRIWDDKHRLARNIRTTIDNAIATGEDPKNTARLLSNATNNSFYNARRVVRTEMTAIIAESDAAAYKELGFEKYTFNAEFDDRTSDVCGDMDGQEFYLHQLQPGTNAPPLHPNCRSTIEAIDITNFQMETRYARGADNKPIRIPSNLTFKEYKEQYLGR